MLSTLMGPAVTLVVPLVCIWAGSRLMASPALEDLTAERIEFVRNLFHELPVD